MRGVEITRKVKGIIARLVRRKQQSGIPSRLDEGKLAVVHYHFIWNIDSHRLFSILIYCK